MKPLPYVHWMPRVKADIKDCLSFSFEPNAVMPYGMVSIRAIRHRRVRNLFYGVKDACGNISDSSVDVCTRLASP